MSEASEFGLLVQGLLTHGAREDVIVLDDPPIDLIGHLLVSLLFHIGAGGPLRLANGVLQRVDPHRTKKAGSLTSSIIAARCAWHRLSCQYDSGDVCR